MTANAENTEHPILWIFEILILKRTSKVKKFRADEQAAARAEGLLFAPKIAYPATV